MCGKRRRCRKTAIGVSTEVKKIAIASAGRLVLTLLGSTSAKAWMPEVDLRCGSDIDRRPH
jgi:hypothetical protein